MVDTWNDQSKDEDEVPKQQQQQTWFNPEMMKIICGLNGWFHWLWEDSLIQWIKDHQKSLKSVVSKLKAED